MLFLAPSLAFSQTQFANGTFNYEGRLFDDNGDPQNGIVSIRLSIVHHSILTCSLYTETFTTVNLDGGGEASKEGFFSIQVGSGDVVDYNPLGTLGEVFKNDTSHTSGVMNGGGSAATFCPTGVSSPINIAATDKRWLKVEVNSGSGFETLSPNIAITAVPAALVADHATNAENLNGKEDSDFIQVTGSVTQTIVENLAASASAILNVSTGSVPTPVAGGDAVNKTYADSHLGGATFPAPAGGNDTQSIRWNNGSSTWEYYTPGGAVTSLTANDPLVNSGTASAPVLDLNIGDGLHLDGSDLAVDLTSDLTFSGGQVAIATDGVTSTHILDDTIDNIDINANADIARSKLAAGTASRVLVNDGTGVMSESATVDSTELGHLDGVTSAIQTQIDSKVATAGDSMTGNLTMEGASGVILNNAGDTFGVTLSGANSASNYPITFPANQGGNGQVLENDGSGNLSWVNQTDTNTTYSADGDGIEESSTVFSIELDGGTLTKTSDGLSVSTDGITNTQMADNAIGNAEMADNAIGNAEMADNAIGNAEMLDNSIGNAEMLDNAIGNAEMADDAIDTAELVDDAVTSAKIDDGTIVVSDVDTASFDARYLNLTAGETLTGALTLGAANSLILNDSDNSDGVSITANGSTTAYNLVLPNSQASGTQVLANDGSGNLSWLTPNVGDITGATNVGSGSGVFESESAGSLNFRRLNAEAGGEITITQNATDITFDVNEGNLDISNMGGYSDVLLRNGSVAMTGDLNINSNSIIGGSAAGNDLVLESTSNATKGDLVLQPNGGDIGIGTASPTEEIHLLTSDNSPRLKVQSTGTDSFPGIHLENDAQNWLMRIAGLSDSFQIFDTTNTAARLTIDNSGDVGIGTDSPSGRLDVEGGDVFIGSGTLDNASGSEDLLVTGNLEVDGTLFADTIDTTNLTYTLNQAYQSGSTISVNSTDGDLIYNLTDTADFIIQDAGAPRFVINDSGDVAIGHSSPGSVLHVIDDSPTTFNREHSTGNTVRNALVLQRSNSGGVGADGIGGSLLFQLEADSEGSLEDAGGVSVVATDSTAGSLSTSLSLNVTNAGTPTTPMTLRSDGRVGLGDSTPNVHLHLSSTDPRIRFEQSGSGAFAEIDASNANGVLKLSSDPSNSFASSGIDFEIDGAVAGSILAGGGIHLNPKSSLSSPASGDVFYDSDDDRLKFHDGTTEHTLMLTSEDGGGDFLVDGSIPMSGQFEAISGSAGAPGVGFDGDENTGLFNPAGGVVGLSADGSLVLSASQSNIISNTIFRSHQSESTAYASSSGSDSSPDGSEIAILNQANLDQSLGKVELAATNAGGTIQTAYVGAVSNSAGNTPTMVFGHQTGTSSYQERMRIDSQGRVGIGATSMTHKLAVVGTVNANAFSINGSTCLHLDGGRIYHDTDCDSTKDIGEEYIDQTPGTSLTGLTTSFDTELGVSASVPTNSSSVAVGTSAIVGAGRNQSVAIGFGTDVTQSNSVGLGFDANVAGVNSVAVGGSSVANGASTVAIGQSASATGNNSIAIGQGTSVSSANTVQLGNASIATTLLMGNVGIGLVANQERLEIEGGIAFKEISAPTTDVATYHKLYVDAADDGLKFRDEAGTVHDLLAGGAPGITDLTGDVTGTGPGSTNTTVAQVGGVLAASVATGVNAANNATSANTASRIVMRDVTGNFSAGNITAGLTGNVTGNLTGNVTGASGTDLSLTAGSGNRDVAILPTGTGNVGIGITGPVSLLHLNKGSGEVGLQIGASGAAAGDHAILDMVTVSGNQPMTNASAKGWRATAFSDAAGGTNANDMAFEFFDAGSITQSNVLRLDSVTGNVGIGAGDPSAKIQVIKTETSNSPPASESVTAKHELNARPSADSAANFRASKNFVTSNGGSGSNFTGSDGLNAVQNIATHEDVGTVSHAKGSTHNVFNNSTGIITNAYSGYFTGMNISTGSITNWFGVRVDAPPTGTFQGTASNKSISINAPAGPNNYAVHSEGTAKSHFRGNIGIGANAAAQDPVAALVVDGAMINAGSHDGSGSTTLDFSANNIIYSTNDCSAPSYTLNNLEDGGRYTLVLQGSAAGTCAFTAPTRTVRLPSSHGPTNVNTHTIYSFLVVGSFVYVSWAPGY